MATIRTTRKTYRNDYTRITQTTKCAHCGANINRRIDEGADEADKMWCHTSGNKRYLMRCDTPAMRGGGPMAEPAARTYTLHVGQVIEQEWSARLPNETQPEFQALFDANPNGGPYQATAGQLLAVKADCEFMLDPHGPNLTATERRAYATLLGRCCRLLGVPQPALKPKAPAVL